MLEILFLPFVLMLAVPGGALIPGLLFLLVAWRKWTRASRGIRFLLLAVVAAWMAYGIYETIMYFWMQTVIAPIRVDLLLIAPVLYLVTLVGLVAAWRVGPRSETS